MYEVSKVTEYIKKRRKMRDKQQSKGLGGEGLSNVKGNAAYAQNRSCNGQKERMQQMQYMKQM